MSTFAENYNRWWNDEKNYVTSSNGSVYWSSYHLNRKYKRHELTPMDVGMLPVNGPKWWNKLRHVRPNRRAWKRVERHLTYCPDDWYGIDLPSPNRKPHDYWW